jgi:hypothetical protein
MSQIIIVKLRDDMDGTDAAETVRFALDGTQYQIDLSESNAAELRKKLSEYIANARTDRKSRDRKSRKYSEEIRQWAKAHGLAVNDRGRIPGSVISEYEESHNLKSSPRKPRDNISPEYSEEVRKWAKAHGHAVKDRGRIPRAIVAQYMKAHNIQPVT